MSRNDHTIQYFSEKLMLSNRVGASVVYRIGLGVACDSVLLSVGGYFVLVFLFIFCITSISSEMP